MQNVNLTAEPGKQAIIITTVFDAPREKVFKIFTDPKLTPLWWGLGYLTTRVDQMEVKPGGMWRIVQHDPQGNEFAFHGVYHEMVAPERVTYTFEYEAMPGHILLETVKFEEEDGGTRMIDTSVFQTVEDRDGMQSSGMEGGTAESMQRLAGLLEGANSIVI